MMVEVVGIRFKETNRVYYFNPQDLDLNKGDWCVVETAEGQALGEVFNETKMVKKNEVRQPLRKILRKVQSEDYKQLAENKKMEEEACTFCLREIRKCKLAMKLVKAKYNFDRSKIIFYFTANTKVDFRELVKRLAAHLKIRIELRQIGVRDEARILGGFGCCGYPLCCTTFLKDFGPVSVHMAKEQGLSLDSSKTSGLCGRLMCCLKYEYETYHKGVKKLPAVGSELTFNKEVGKVIDVNVLKESVILKFENGKKVEVPAKELK